MNFILLQSFANYIDAHIIMGRLQEEGINCWLKDENTVTIDPILTNAVGGIKLMVAKEQIQRASELLQQFDKQKRKNFSCPKCGSHDIELVSSPRKAVNWLSAFTGFFLGDYAIGANKTWHCFNCSEEFKKPVETNRKATDN